MSDSSSNRVRLTDEHTPKRRRVTKPRGPQLTIELTKELIETAKRRDSSHCMIAEAIKEAYPSAQRISVDIITARFSDPDRGLRYTYLMPRRAQVALIDFDQGNEVETCRFRLRNAQVTSKFLRKRALMRESEYTVPRKVGGQTPPKSNLGKIRAFGLRGMRP
jgi:hypothetical protein